MFDRYTPDDWFWIVTGDDTRAWSSAVSSWVSSWPTEKVTRVRSLDDLNGVLRAMGRRSPVITTDDIDREYIRRLCAILGARDLSHAGFIRADDHVERQALREIDAQNDEQTARLAELDARDAAVALLIERYNAIPDNPPPADYAADARWS